MARARITQKALENAIPLPFEIPESASAQPDRPIVDREERFFSSRRTPASQVKSKIVVDTFLGWSGVMLNQNPLALWYLDLYCGRGTYEDGSPSTPMELFDKVVKNDRLSRVLRMLFNDHRARFVFALSELLLKHPEYASLRNPPMFSRGEVDESMVTELRTRRPKAPTFAFIDPFGYKGLTQTLIHTVLAEYGCDVLFFFAYHPIKRVLNNPNFKLRGHVESLLGAKRVAYLRELLRGGVSEKEMERSTIKALAESMRAIDGQDVLTFAFRRRTGYASHHLAFVSKNIRGFEVAKEAMARASSWSYADDIPSLEFVEQGYDNVLALDSNAPSISKLKALLVHRCGGQTLSYAQAYDQILLGTNYVKANVREAFVRLVREHDAPLFSDGRSAHLKGSRLPHNATIIVPRTLRT